jgi:hypothetical protein
MWKYVLAWLPMVAIAIANGALREAWYARDMGELQAHQLSTLIALVLLGGYIAIVMRLWRPASSRQAIAVGLMWLALTLAFEFLFGHYVARRPWDALLHDYSILAGRVWLAVPMLVAVAPYLFHRSLARRCP